MTSKSKFLLESLSDQYQTKKAHYTVPFWYNFLMRFGTNRLDKVASYLPSKKVHILDIGCAHGEFIEKFHKRFRSIVGVDIIPRHIQEAKKLKLSAPAEFLELDCGHELLPFSSKKFDVVVSIATLLYIFNLEQLIREIHRVLKTDGTFIFSVPNAVYILRRLTWLSGHLPTSSCYENGWNAGILHSFTIPELKQFLEKEGFEVQEVSCSGVFDSVRSLWPSMLGADSIFVCKKR